MNLIDELMDRDPLNLSAQDIDTIIAYERKQRQLFESGVKPTKAEKQTIAVDMSSILAALTPKGAEPETPKPMVRRRV